VGLPNTKITNVLNEDFTFQSATQPSVFEYTDEIRLQNFRLLPKEGLDDD
jgi:hypothetical protein